MITLSVPTLNDRAEDFDRLFHLWQQANDDFQEVIFDFSRCKFLRQNAVAFVGGLARLIEHRGGQAIFAWETLREEIRANLAQNGFLGAFGNPGGPWSGNSIPYREDRRQDKDGLANYLKSHWLGRGWVQVSAPLRDAIVGRVWEIYENAFEHAQSAIGVFSCGQHYPNLHELKLTVVDFGVGIPSNVRWFKKNPLIRAERALQWAFQPGASTSPDKSRGMGLDLLKNFVKLNGGKLEVFSHEGYALISQRREIYLHRPTFFEGTLANITLRCDESYYRLASEGADEPLF